ncbi:hypothetical protein ACFQGE_18100 [Halomicroarcula sp. GCM10025817]|uniref:hypothetical protein n=1 Tax=Haloarcula TaxID=2237 RepID=UPI0023E78052|nr:hypothetical protein [Halomicroarcula sp. SYNS111]
MSVTPKGGGTGGQSVPRDDADDRSLTRRVLDGLTEVLRRVPGVRRVVPEGDDRDRTEVSGDSLADTAVDPPQGGSVAGLPDRRRPFTYPARNRSERNAVELVGETRQDTLTITHPDNPDASITSDVWEDVEP